MTSKSLSKSLSRMRNASGLRSTTAEKANVVKVTKEEKVKPLKLDDVELGDINI